MCHNIALLSCARVVKLVDAGDSKSPAARRAGSIPAPGTIGKSYRIGLIATLSNSMNDDDFSNIVRSGTGHSVSVSEHTGNAKNPKNMVASHQEETEARKRAFEQKALAALDAEKALTAALAEHTEHVAPTDGEQDTNIQKVTSEKAADNLQNMTGDDAAKPNIQSVSTEMPATNNQMVNADRIQDNIQTVGSNKSIDPNVQNISADAIAPNLQNIGDGNIDTNRHNIADEKAIETSRQGIGEQSLGDNNQAIPHDTAGLNRQSLNISPTNKTNSQAHPQDDESSNRQALNPYGTSKNSANIAHDTSGKNDQTIAKLGLQDNKQSLNQGVPTQNNQPLASAPGLTPNNQSVNTDAPSLNRQAVPQGTSPALNRQGLNNDKIESHLEQLPSEDVDRKKVDFSAPQDKGRSSALRIKANGSRAPVNATERQQATLNRNHAMDVFHGRLAGIKQNVDALNSRLTDLEEKVHTDDAKLEKGKPKDFNVD